MGAILTGKHDKLAAVPQDRPELLHTGPIAIRGVGRATRDFFRPDRVSKHRLTAEQREAAAREAEEDATATEQIDAAMVTDAVGEAGGEVVTASGPEEARSDRPLGAAVDLDDGNERPSTARIPSASISAPASALGSDSGDPEPRRGRAQPQVWPIPDFPTALDARAVQELQRLVLLRAQAAESEHAAGGDRSDSPSRRGHSVGAFGEPTVALGGVALADRSPGIDAGVPDGPAKSAVPLEGAGEQDVRSAFGSRALGEAEPAGRLAEDLDKPSMTGDAGIVEKAAPPDAEPGERSVEARGDEQHADGTAASADPDGEGVEEPLGPSQSSDRADVEPGGTPDPAGGDTRATDAAEPDNDTQDEDATGLRYEQARADAPGRIDLSASPTPPTSTELDEEDRSTEPAAASAVEAFGQSEPTAAGPEQVPPAGDPFRQTHLAEPSSGASTDQYPTADARTTGETVVDGERLETPVPGGLEVAPGSDAEALPVRGHPSEPSEPSEDAPAPESVGEVPPGESAPDPGGTVSVEASAMSGTNGLADVERLDAGGAIPEHLEAPDEPEPSEEKPSPDSLDAGAAIEALVGSDPAEGLGGGRTTVAGTAEAGEPGDGVCGGREELTARGDSSASVEENPGAPGEHDQVAPSSDLLPEVPNRFQQPDPPVLAMDAGASSALATDGADADGTSRLAPDREGEANARIDQALPDRRGPASARADAIEPAPPVGPASDASEESSPAARPITPRAGAADEATAVDVETATSEPAPRNASVEGSLDTPAASLLARELSAPERDSAAALAAGFRPPNESMGLPEAASRPRRANVGRQLEGPQPVPAGDVPPPPDAPRPPRPARSARSGSSAGGRLWSYIALSLLALLCVGLITAVIMKTRDDAAVAAKEAAAYTAPPLIAPSSPAPASTLPVVSVVGDEVTAGSSSDSGTRSEWPALLASALHAEVKTIAASGAGYVTEGAGGATFVTEAARVDPASSVVVLFGGTNDVTSSPLSVATAATKAISAARAAAPSAKIVVVGPVSSVTTPSSALLAIRDSLKTAAKIGKAGWQDPIAGRWLSSSASLTTSSGTPNDRGEKALESKLQAALKGLTQR